jgi:hypothetical protein
MEEWLDRLINVWMKGVLLRRWMNGCMDIEIELNEVWLDLWIDV